MGETSWMAWPGWAFVGTVAQVLSLVTLVVGAWRFTRQRRQFPLVLFDWAVIGKTTLVRSDTYHVVEFRNLGRSSAVIQQMVFQGARVELTEKYMAPRLVESGGSFRLLITAHRIDDVWFRMLTQAPDDKDRFVLTWHPLARSGLLFEQAKSELTEWYQRPYVDRMRDHFRGVPVHPGAAPRGVLRRGKKPDRQRRINEPGNGTGDWSAATAGAKIVTDIPRVR